MEESALQTLELTKGHSEGSGERKETKRGEDRDVVGKAKREVRTIVITFKACLRMFGACTCLALGGVGYFTLWLAS